MIRKKCLGLRRRRENSKPKLDAKIHVGANCDGAGARVIQVRYSSD